MEFKQLLENHLEALVSKDFNSFIETVSSENITLIMPNGNLITKHQVFSDLHKAWFSDNDWSISYEIIHIMEKSDICTALLSVDYKDVNENNEPVTLLYYLNLIFEKKDDSWFLIYDQNTIYTK